MTRTGFVQKDQVAILSNDYDANRAKLRAGNLIETSLNLDDGMSSLQIAKTVSHANAAKKWSLATYPSNSNHEDAARHFAWNYLSTKDSSIGQLKTKIATTNHEWGLVLLPGALSYFDDKYDYYVSIGNSEPGANALIATSAYLSYLRHNLTLLSENSYSIFKSLFTVDNIMDLNNNCYGRAYSVRYPSNTVFSSFTKAISNKEIILSQSNVDNSAYYIVWNNKWYKSK